MPTTNKLMVNHPGNKSDHLPQDVKQLKMTIFLIHVLTPLRKTDSENTAQLMINPILKGVSGSMLHNQFLQR